MSQTEKLPKLALTKKLLIAITLMMFVSACQTIDSTENWPSNLPDRQIFVDAYQVSVDAGEKVIKLEPHLVWIKRFYQGTVVYPFGWNRMTDLVIESLTRQHNSDNSLINTLESGESWDAKIDSITMRLYKLGLDISREWAKDNNIRKINSSNIAIWGSTLRKAAKQGMQIAFLVQVEQDVADLLSGKISADDITNARYFPPEDFDDF